MKWSWSIFESYDDKSNKINSPAEAAGGFLPPAIDNFTTWQLKRGRGRKEERALGPSFCFVFSPSEWQRKQTGRLRRGQRGNGHRVVVLDHPRSIWINSSCFWRFIQLNHRSSPSKEQLTLRILREQGHVSSSLSPAYLDCFDQSVKSARSQPNFLVWCKDVTELNESLSLICPEDLSYTRLTKGWIRKGIPMAS